MSTMKIAAALSLVGAMSLTSIAPANSAPLTPLSVAAKPDVQTEQVRFGGWHGGWGGGWRGGGWGGGWGVGLGALAAGALIGGALAAPYYGGYGGYYGGDPYAYDDGYAYPSYAYSSYYPAYRPYRAHAYRPYVRPYYHRHLYRHW